MRDNFFRPDHNGECLNCDEWEAAHGPRGECPTAWDYIHSDFRREMIATAKEATRACGVIVYDHHPLCSNFTQPVEHCWQCRIITSGATDA